MKMDQFNNWKNLENLPKYLQFLKRNKKMFKIRANVVLLTLLLVAFRRRYF